MFPVNQPTSPVAQNNPVAQSPVPQAIPQMQAPAAQQQVISVNQPQRVLERYSQEQARDVIKSRLAFGSAGTYGFYVNSKGNGLTTWIQVDGTPKQLHISGKHLTGLFGTDWSNGFPTSPAGTFPEFDANGVEVPGSHKINGDAIWQAFTPHILSGKLSHTVTQDIGGAESVWYRLSGPGGPAKAATDVNKATALMG